MEQTTVLILFLVKLNKFRQHLPNGINNCSNIVLSKVEQRQHFPNGTDNCSNIVLSKVEQV